MEKQPRDVQALWKRVEKDKEQIQNLGSPEIVKGAEVHSAAISPIEGCYKGPCVVDSILNPRTIDDHM
ncbi:OLC1v1030558C1, partial [Oldenlandia corymbosa var. corymbosa]